MKINILGFAAALVLFFYSADAQTLNKPAFDKATTPNLPEGSLAPNFSFKTVDGKEVKLSDYKGKTVILDVWATWCVPCLEEMPKIDSLVKTLKNQNVIMIGVCTADSRVSFNNFMQKNKDRFDCKLVFDPYGKKPTPNSFRTLYGINGFPTTMLIDGSGIIKGYGYMYNDINYLLHEHLKQIKNDK